MSLPTDNPRLVCEQRSADRNQAGNLPAYILFGSVLLYRPEMGQSRFQNQNQNGIGIEMESTTNFSVEIGIDNP